MANITASQKSEIIKLIRNEFMGQVRGMKKVSEQNRREIVALKRMVTKLQQQLERGTGKVTAKSTQHAGTEARARVRFSAKGLCSERKRLGLSAEEYGKLLGVSAQSIYNWEREVTRPRNNYVRMIAAVRGIGKKEARTRLTKQR